MGWTRSSLNVTVALAMEEHRRAAGQRLAKIRDAAGLNQEELAHKAGLAVKTISRLETGRHDGRRSTLKRVAAALEVDVDDIVGPPPAPLGLDAGESQLDRIEARLEDLQSKVGRLLLALEADGLSGALGRVADDLGAVVGGDADSRSRAGKTGRSGDSAGSRTPARAPKTRRA